MTAQGFVKAEPTKVRTYSQKVRGHGRVVITKVGAIAVTHVPPYTKEQGRLQITSEKTSKKSFRKISAHLSSPQESAAAWLSAHAFNPWKSVVPLSQLSVGRDRAVLKSIWSASKELCLCFWNSASFYKSRCFFRENCFLHERSLFANTSSEIPTECSAVTHENRPAGFFKPNLFSRVDSKNWSKSLSLKNRKLEKCCWPGNRNYCGQWYKWYPQHRIQGQG